EPGPPERRDHQACCGGRQSGIGRRSCGGRPGARERRGGRAALRYRRRRDHPGEVTTMLAGIIGGTGQMGRFFAGVFEEAGWDVIVSGTKTPLTNRDVAEMADLVMVSVPIRATVGVIREVAPLLSEEQVFCDL